MARRKAERRQVLVQPAAAAIPLDYEALIAADRVHDLAHRQAVQAINMALTLRNWLIGYHIVE